MREVLYSFVTVVLVVSLLGGARMVHAKGTDSQTDSLKASSAADKSGSDVDLNISPLGRVNAVIYPFQSATISTEVRGLVDLMNYQEGDAVKKGAVVTEVSKARYSYIRGEFKGNYDAVCRTLEQAKKDLEVQEGLYERRATTYQDLLKARSDVRILEARKHEAENKLKQAELNVQACVIKAPFSGIIGVLYHDPYEAVDNLEKIFELVDTHKVYARSNWPEKRLSEIAIGKKAVFYHQGKSYEGVIKKISKLIDPASRSKRIHVLIDNPHGDLEVGMSGSLEILKPGKVSSKSSRYDNKMRISSTKR